MTEKKAIAVYLCVSIIFITGILCAGNLPRSTAFITPESWMPHQHLIASDIIAPFNFGFFMTHYYDEDKHKYIFCPYFEAVPDYDPAGERPDDNLRISFYKLRLNNESLGITVNLDVDSMYRTTRELRYYDCTLDVNLIKLKRFELDTLPDVLRLEVGAEIADSLDRSQYWNLGYFADDIKPIERSGGCNQWATSKERGNPFSTGLTISYSVFTPGLVTLVVHDVQGNVVDTLVNGEYELGIYDRAWDGKDKNGKSLPSGIYFYKVTTPDGTYTKKMVLLK